MALDFLGRTEVTNYDGETISDAEERYPVLFFFHGLGSTMDLSFGFCQQLASHGFIVIAFESSCGAASLTTLADGTLLEYVRPPVCQDPPRWTINSFREPQLVHRVRHFQEDVQILLGPECPELFRNRLDFSRVFVGGHSFGGATACMVSEVWEDIFPSEDIVLRGVLLQDPWMDCLSNAVVFRGLHERVVAEFAVPTAAPEQPPAPLPQHSHLNNLPLQLPGSAKRARAPTIVLDSQEWDNWKDHRKREKAYLYFANTENDSLAANAVRSTVKDRLLASGWKLKGMDMTHENKDKVAQEICTVVDQLATSTDSSRSTGIHRSVLDRCLLFSYSGTIHQSFADCSLWYCILPFFAKYKKWINQMDFHPAFTALTYTFCDAANNAPVSGKFPSVSDVIANVEAQFAVKRHLFATDVSVAADKARRWQALGISTLLPHVPRLLSILKATRDSFIHSESAADLDAASGSKAKSEATEAHSGSTKADSADLDDVSALPMGTALFRQSSTERIASEA